MLADMKTREEAEKYIDSILDNTEYYNFESDEEREELRQGRLRNWELDQEENKDRGNRLQDHIVKEWDENEFNKSFKNWDEMTFFEKAFIKTVNFFDKNTTFDPTITRESLIDKVITETMKNSPEINSDSYTYDKLTAYREALINTGLRNTFTPDDILMYVNQQRDEQPLTTELRI